MNSYYLVTPLILFSLAAVGQSQDAVNALTFADNKEAKNSLVLQYTNETEHFNVQEPLNRSVDFPTQIIRMDENIENQQVTCAVVHEQINKILVQYIVNDKFTYSIYINCHYNPDTNLATQLIINSFFDPLSDEAITYLNAYLAEYNGAEILGTKFKIESAKSLIISLNIAAGVRKNPKKPPFISYRADRSNFYFKNNYDMKKKLFTDIYQNFFTPEPDKILPFLNKWFFSYAGMTYKNILRDSNYVELQPEKIFIMDNEDIFVSILKQTFIHYCEQYENHKCLNLNPT